MRLSLAASAYGNAVPIEGPVALWEGIALAHFESCVTNGAVSRSRTQTYPIRRLRVTYEARRWVL